MDWMNSLFLLGGALLFLSVVSTTLSARLGMPLLLVFLAVGMLAGEEGVGGIAFNNVVMANFISQLALAVILLDGGLRTQLSSFRIALKPASVLASWGVFATVLPLGLFATFYLGLDWKFGVLMAAIVGSTDLRRGIQPFAQQRRAFERTGAGDFGNRIGCERPDGGFFGYGTDYHDYAVSGIGCGSVCPDACAANRFRSADGLGGRKDIGKAGTPSESCGRSVRADDCVGRAACVCVYQYHRRQRLLAVYL